MQLNTGRRYLDLTLPYSLTVDTVKNACPLSVNDITFSYPNLPEPVLADVSFEIPESSMVALVGPNGAGKSTLLKLIAGIEVPQQGEVVVFGQESTKAKHLVAYVPQRSEVNWKFPVTVREVVMMGRYVHLGWLHWPRRVDKEVVENALEDMQILDLIDRQIGELSGGQQQRVMLARALAQEARLLVLDEPLNNLDMPTQELIFHLMADLTKQGITILISTHDLGLLRSHFDRALFLDHWIIADGPINEVLTADTLAKAYGVELHIENSEHRHDASG